MTMPQAETYLAILTGRADTGNGRRIVPRRRGREA
ncbi:hypothetical protein DesfrDRAFT_1198 [Solidesulfovibrio fructosivorans JJ]]|uniref:Uncharacterized protein n=1 Tax=Solidesulfovibrio fructosivorans JJ] TaxID=596151 RepID=E1JU99_SOLFR|nr:hypothetical protein DesfrDRAFT_1198 [Solidesulfovibrio fructosivorans JJ]]